MYINFVYVLFVTRKKLPTGFFLGKVIIKEKKQESNEGYYHSYWYYYDYMDYAKIKTF